MKTSIPQKQQGYRRTKRDTRVPASVTHVGRFTVRVYDEQGYQDALEQYNQGDTQSIPTTKKRYHKPIPKRSYGWYGERVKTSA